MQCWYSDALGSKVPADERQPQITGILFAWLDGECSASGHWSAGSFSQTSGNLSLWRWRVFDAPGRLSFVKAAKVACKDCCVQQWSAEFCRTRDEGCRDTDLWHKFS